MFDIPEELKAVQPGGECFIKLDTGHGPDRLSIDQLLGSTDQLLGTGETCIHFFADGTFGTAPPQFLQIYSVHGIKDGYNLPIAFAFLVNKQTTTYVSYRIVSDRMVPTPS